MGIWGCTGYQNITKGCSWSTTGTKANWGRGWMRPLPSFSSSFFGTSPLLGSITIQGNDVRIIPEGIFGGCGGGGSRPLARLLRLSICWHWCEVINSRSIVCIVGAIVGGSMISLSETPGLYCYASEVTIIQIFFKKSYQLFSPQARHTH